ncbi:hypothetical protein [Halomonas elongata]|nr:hypothetical protein [Halomonas elongata]
MKTPLTPGCSIQISAVPTSIADDRKTDCIHLFKHKVNGVSMELVSAPCLPWPFRPSHQQGSITMQEPERKLIHRPQGPDATLMLPIADFQCSLRDADPPQQALFKRQATTQQSHSLFIASADSLMTLEWIEQNLPKMLLVSRSLVQPHCHCTSHAAPGIH